MSRNSGFHNQTLTIDLTLSDEDEETSANGSDAPARQALQQFNPRKGHTESPRSVLQQFQPRKLPPQHKPAQSVSFDAGHTAHLQHSRGRAIRSTTQDPRRRFNAIASRHSRTNTPTNDNNGDVSPAISASDGSKWPSKLNTRAAVMRGRDTPTGPTSSSSNSASNEKSDIWNSRQHLEGSKSDKEGQDGVFNVASGSIVGQLAEPARRSFGFSSEHNKERDSLSQRDGISHRKLSDTFAQPTPSSHIASTDQAQTLQIGPSSHNKEVVIANPGFPRPVPSSPASEVYGAVNEGPGAVDTAEPTGAAVSTPRSPVTMNAENAFSNVTQEISQPVTTNTFDTSGFDLEENKVLDLARQFGNERTLRFVHDMFSSLREQPHEGKIRVALWTQAEDLLIVHIRKELGGSVSWKATGDFFPHRKSWHPMQSRFSTMLQHFTVESLAENFSQDGNVRTRGEKRPILQRQEQPSQNTMTVDEHGHNRLNRPKRAVRIDQPGLYRERRPLSLSPESGLLSHVENLSYGIASGSQTRHQPGRHSPPANDPTTAPVSRRGCHNGPLPQSERLYEERRRNLAALASVMMRIPGPNKSYLVERPYLPKHTRTYCAKEPNIWDESASSLWAGSTLHVDLDEDELEAVERAAMSVRKLAVTDRSLTLQERLHVLLTGVPREQIHQISGRVIWHGTCLGRSQAAIADFICDVRDGHYGSTAGISEIVSLAPSPPTYNRGRMLRSREMRQSKLKTSLEEFDTLGPALHYKGTSGDVNQVAWAPDGEKFAIASFAVTDQSSLAYNKPNNLLFGQLTEKSLLELPQHSTHVDKYERASTIQESLIFQTVSELEFSSDGSYLVTVGYDRHARVWDICGERPREIASIEHDQRIDVVSINSKRIFATGSQGYTASDGERTAGPSVRVLRVGEVEAANADDLSVNTYLLSSRAKLLDPACLRFNHANGGQYLLGTFSSSDPTIDKGVLAIWDIANLSSAPITQFSSGNIFDAVWSPHASGRIAVGSSRLDNAAYGAQSVVRIYDSSSRSRSLNINKDYTLELKCPARDMNDVSFCPTDSFLVSIGCTDGQVYVWDIRKPDSLLHICAHGKTLSEKDENDMADTGVRFLSWGQNGRNIYSGSSDGVVMQWDPYRAPEDAYVRDVVQLESGVMSGAFSPDFTNLLLGDVAGNVSLLSVGNEDRGMDMCQADPFEFKEAVAFKRNLRQGSEEIDSARSSARALLESGKVEIRPFGNLPKMQAVQGPTYVEPTAYNLPPGYQPCDPVIRQIYYQDTVPKLREAAAKFQGRAREHESIGPCRCMTDTNWVTEEDFGDSGAWKERIPAEIRKARAQCLDRAGQMVDSSHRLELIKLPVRCFRCNKHELTSAHGSKTSGMPDDTDDLYMCLGCSSKWRVEMLGYTPIHDPTTPRGRRTNLQSTKTLAKGNINDGENDDTNYYNTLWD